MAHEVSSMAYQGNTPWHGIGEKLSPNQSIDIWAESAGLNWKILNSPVHYATQKSGCLQEIHSFGGKQVLYRSDTKFPLSVVSDRYKVVQPIEILEFYRDLTEKSGFELETAGVLKDGKKMWALARTGQSASIKGNDLMNGYLLLATACDGSMATTAQFTSVRVVCNNTLAISLKHGQGAVKVPHSKAFDPTLVKQRMGLATSNWEEFMYKMKGLSERRLKDSEARQFIHSVFQNANGSNIIYSNEKAKAKVLTLYNGHGMGSGFASSKNTAFGLLNAVTEYVDHQQKAKNAHYRLDSAWFGNGANMKERAFNESLKLIA